MPKEKFVIAIDGPAGSGKSTTAAGVARELGVVHVNTGAMYRSLTVLALEKGLEHTDIDALGALAEEMKLVFERQPDGSQSVVANGRDITKEIRTELVSTKVPLYCQAPAVRKAMVKKQRETAEATALVLEGRDIGTVVFPNAEYKFFLIASIEERAKRRLKDYEKAGQTVSLESIKAEIAERDRIDSTRPVSPLKKADDAIELDTTGLTIEEQIAKIVNIVKSK